MKQKLRLGTVRSVIATGYVFIAAVIGCILWTWVNEWHELETLEAENRRIDTLRDEVHALDVQIIGLSLAGETFIDWNEEKLAEYHAKRMVADSVLRKMKELYPNRHIDSVRNLLADKEQKLTTIRDVLAEQETINAKIARQVPVIARRSATEEPKKKKRRSGFLGIFGKKVEEKPTVTTSMLYTLNRDVIAQQQEQSRRLSQYADSLTAHNRKLNRQIQEVIYQLDNKIREDLRTRETHIADMREKTFIQISVLTGIAVLLLVMCYIAMHRSTNRVKRYKVETASLIERLEGALDENRRLTDARRKFMQTITHELRTPLAAIQGYAELLPDENSLNKRNRYSDNIRQSARRMLSMLTSLLDFFRLESGKEQPHPAPFRLQSITDALGEEFRPLTEYKGLNLDIDNDSDVVLDGDRELITRICDNLLSNAVKFTEHGTVSFRSAYSDGNLTITVADTGSGMDKEERQRVFGAFERLSNAATQDGFGLGLSIVSHIVTMLGGTIHLDSEKGKGSCFTITLPVPLADSRKRENTAGTDSTRPSDTSYNVAIIDDNDMILGMSREMYARNGIRCDTFREVGDLMEALRKKPYDLLITDLKMPDMNGYEVLELLRSSNIGNSKTVPVIVATASGSCVAEELEARGFSGCLFKPFSMTELLAVSEKCVSSGLEKDNAPDFSSLLAYGGGCRLLDSLISETESDLKKLAQAEATDNRKAIAAIAHHLRSSWGVIRADRPLWILNTLLNNPEGCSGEELDRAIQKVLEQGRAIIVAAKEERGKYGKNHRD